MVYTAAWVIAFRPPFYQIHKEKLSFEAKDLLVTFLQTWPKSFKVGPTFDFWERWGGRIVGVEVKKQGQGSKKQVPRDIVAKGGGGWCLLCGVLKSFSLIATSSLGI